MIWGGRDLTSYKGDLFIFNSITETWTEYFPSSSLKPRPAYGACMVFLSPLIYLYGGKAESQISNELWQYDIGTNNYTLVSDQGVSSVKYSFCFYNMSRLYVAFGSLSDEEPSTSINFYDFKEKQWQNYHNHKMMNFDAAQADYMFIDPQVLVLGGENWMLSPVKKVAVFNEGQDMKILDSELDQYSYAGASAYFNKSLFVFGGGVVIGKSLRAEVAHNLLMEINIDEICGQGLCNSKCSPGTFADNSICYVCPKGKYATGYGNENCLECPSGTFNDNLGSTSVEQCLPCSEGFYNEISGSESCLRCPDDKYCPVGCKLPMDKVVYESSPSIQPPLFHKPDLKKSLIVYQVMVSVPIFILLLILLIIPRCRSLIIKLDLFDLQHENEESSYLIVKKTLIGGIFSFLLIIGTFLLIGSALISFFKSNIQESRGLIPLVVLESEASSIISQDLSLQLYFDLYGGECSKDSQCLSSFQLSLTSLQCSNLTYSCKLTEANSCKIFIKCKNAEIKHGSQISVGLTEKLSYASGIRVNLTSSSSIPDQISSVVLAIKPNSGQIFIGSPASEFYFIATPSLFRSESSDWPDEETGFHISAGNNVKLGNQVRPESLPSVSYLFVEVFIETSTSGLITIREVKQDFIFLASSILGSASGLFAIAGFFMGQVEKLVRILDKWRNDKRRVKDENDSKKVQDGLDVTNGNH